MRIKQHTPVPYRTGEVLRYPSNEAATVVRSLASIAKAKAKA